MDLSLGMQQKSWLQFSDENQAVTSLIKSPPLSAILRKHASVQIGELLVIGKWASTQGGAHSPKALGIFKDVPYHPFCIRTLSPYFSFFTGYSLWAFITPL